MLNYENNLIFTTKEVTDYRLKTTYLGLEALAIMITSQSELFKQEEVSFSDLAGKMLSEWHIDMWSITRGMTLATFINQLITIIHKLFYNGKSESDRELYEVRTRKIINYSNLIATSSNIAVVAITRDF